MSIIVRVITTAWPFIKEIFFKDETVKKFIHENKWQIGNALFSLTLFLLFINLFLVTTQKDKKIYELEGYLASAKMQVEHCSTSRENDKLFFEERLDTFKEELDKLEEELDKCQKPAPPQGGRKPSPPKAPATIDRDYIDDLEDLQAQG